MKRLIISTLLALLATIPARSMAADATFTPFIIVGEEFTDNVYDSSTTRKSDYITRLRPGFSSKYEAPRWKWDAAYNFDYRYYARNSKSNDHTHDASLNGNISIVENLFFLDLADTYKRVSLDLYRDSTTESLYLNQTDQNIANISPYLLWRIDSKSSLKTGYRYTDIRYFDSIGIDKQAHGAYADFTHELTEKLKLMSGYAFRHQESRLLRDDKHDISVGFRFDYAEKSFLFGTIGNSWQQFSNGDNRQYLFWNAGITHDFKVLTATAEAKRQVTEDPQSFSTTETTYMAKLDRAFERGAVGASAAYSEYIKTQTGLFDRRRTAFGITGRYEITKDLAANIGFTGERYSVKSSNEYPYRLTGTGGLSYLLMKDLTLALNYTHIAYQNKIDTTAGGRATNRAVLELKKTF